MIHKSNGGLVSARKAGLLASHGEYIGYVDGEYELFATEDDYLEYMAA